MLLLCYKLHISLYATKAFLFFSISTIHCQVDISDGEAIQICDLEHSSVTALDTLQNTEKAVHREAILQTQVLWNHQLALVHDHPGFVDQAHLGAVQDQFELQSASIRHGIKDLKL